MTPGTAKLRRLARHDPIGRGGRTVRVGGKVVFGGARPVIIAGPCAVESLEQTLDIAREVKAAGGDMLRGGAFKPRTSPYDFQGLGKEGLEILHAARAETGLPVVTEVMDVRLMGLVCEHADMLQVGSRSMQNFPLLRELGRLKVPVLLKRGMSATLEEWLCAAEYIASGGNENIVLCERGLRTAWTGEYDRNTLDTNVIEAVKRAVDLPVIVDPSHSTGFYYLVPGASLAGIAAGADGLIIEVVGRNTNRDDVKCDAMQGVRPDSLASIVRASRRVHDARMDLIGLEEEAREVQKA